jgi:cytochrome b pre-mRNA-processing protein 3
MNVKYINIYNNLINLTRNKKLYQNFENQDTFSDRVIFFLLHLAFFLKVFKKDNDKKIMQEIYDYLFRQLELSIREIGYGDQSINKKMKNYLNLFYSMIDKIHFWENLSLEKKESILLGFVDKNADVGFLVDYFEKYRLYLINNTLNSFIKGVVNP